MTKIRLNGWKRLPLKERISDTRIEERSQHADERPAVLNGAFFGAGRLYRLHADNMLAPRSAYSFFLSRSKVRPSIDCIRTIRGRTMSRSTDPDDKRAQGHNG